MLQPGELIQTWHRGDSPQPGDRLHPQAPSLPAACLSSGAPPALPVGLCFLQELHLVLHTGAGLQLLHHHLRAADARVHLPQEHLWERDRHVLIYPFSLHLARSGAHSAPCNPHPSEAQELEQPHRDQILHAPHPRIPTPRCPMLTLPNHPCPISFRYSRLCLPRSADLRSCTVTEHIQLPVRSCAHPYPQPTRVTRRIQLSPGVLPAAPPHAVLGCSVSSGGAIPRHPTSFPPSILVWPCRCGDMGLSHAQRWGAALCPFSSPRMGRAEWSRAGALAFSHSPGPLLAQVLPLVHPCQGVQQWGYCWAASRRPSPATLLLFSELGRATMGARGAVAQRPPPDSSPTRCLVYAGLGLVGAMGKSTLQGGSAGMVGMG